MKIKRINKVKNYRAFNNFAWPASLPDFGDRVLIYGWNGTGKTTLSTIFQAVEKRQNIDEGECELMLSNSSKVSSLNFSSSDSSLPKVRVFNKKFVAENVFTGTDILNPIIVIGKSNIEMHKKVETLKEAMEEVIVVRNGMIKERKSLSDALEKFSAQQARHIKELLRTNDKNKYSYYDKQDFKAKCKQMSDRECQEYTEASISDEQKEHLTRQKNSSPMQAIPRFAFSFPNCNDYVRRVKAVLGKKIVSKSIQALKENPNLAKWVQDGLVRHLDIKGTTCLFCGQDLPSGLIQKLEEHFSVEFKLFVEEIDSLRKRIEWEILQISQISFPNSNEFYGHIAPLYETCKNALYVEILKFKEFLNSLIHLLDNKRANIFDCIAADDLSCGMDDTLYTELISELNDVISKHNSITNNFKRSIEQALCVLEESFVDDCLNEYCDIVNNIDLLDLKINQDGQKIEEINGEISEILKIIEDHREAAEQLNADLHAYLGRSDISLVVKEDGYQITRYGQVADNLSEGEMTAIALLYFLKSLHDDSFNLENGVVVVDDPVTSLDSNAIFYALGFLKKCTERAGQLFVLTHNHLLFRQVRYWFKKKRKNCFYMTVCQPNGDGRNSSIKELDYLLKNFESEYHYLFSCVYRATQSEDNKQFDHFYHLSNMARRLLDAFIYFKYPGSETDLASKVDRCLFDDAKKYRIVRFLNTYSHHDHIDSPEHDPSALSESKEVLSDILALIEAEDQNHFLHMKDLVMSDS